MSDDKQAVKATKTVAVITLIPVYPEAGKAPHPVGTKLSVAPYRAEFWVSRGIAAYEKTDTDGVNRVGPSVDSTVQSAALPAAPPMTPLPKLPGA